MKAHLTKLSLALLSAVFLLGCQEQGSEPVGPEGLGPEFGHKPTHNPGGGGEEPTDEATFEATFVESAVENAPLCTEVGIDDCHIVGTIEMHETAVGLQTFAGTPDVEGTPAMLDLTFFAGDVTDEGGYTADEGTLCFGVPDHLFTAPFQIIVKKNDLPDVLSFLEPFEAKGDDGSTLVKYRLELFGVTDGTLPPDEGKTTTITIERFNMRHSSGPGRKVACTGTGGLSSFIEVTRTTP